jgi:4-hydroxythreonine-4-phosphate dehydrogenase
MSRKLSPLAVTMGEPAGIGPDIILQAFSQKAETSLPPFIVVGCAQTLHERACLTGHSSIQIAACDAVSNITGTDGNVLYVLDQPVDGPVQPGKPSANTAGQVISWIEKAVSLALAGNVSGMVTAPIQKETLYHAGFSHQGHTDYLAHLAIAAGHAATPVMMISAGSFRTVPLSVHIPLADVPAAVTGDEIISQARIIHSDLKRYFAIAAPRIAIAGLNPHAGEGGRIGTQDRDIIAPAVEALNGEGIAAFGPVSADTLFHEEARATYDLALCMYHDQALIPVKTLGFHIGVNTTLGLPFVRTSPDHGTALDLAGTGKANPSSFIAALRQAAAMAEAAQ